MAFPFRVPRSAFEADRMRMVADTFRSMGRMDAADQVEAAVRAARLDPTLMAGVEDLRGFNPRLPEEDGIDMLLRRLAGTDMPAPEPTSFPGYARGTDYDKANRSYSKFRSGSMFNLPNMRKPIPQIYREDMLRAAERNISEAALAGDAENAARLAAVAGAAGLGGMIAETNSRLFPGEAVATGSPVADEPASDPLMDFVAPDVDMLPVDDMPIPQERFPAPQFTDAELGLADFSPMDTADLVAESRPIPDSTPVVPQLTPEEIAALRGNVVSIRDAKTGQAMDSFYPPESEEYKREQRMKLRYPQLRR